jgi:hypothetical protein
MQGSIAVTMASERVDAKKSLALGPAEAARTSARKIKLAANFLIGSVHITAAL